VAQQPTIQCLPILHFFVGDDDVRSVYFMAKHISHLFCHLLIVRSNTRQVVVGQVDKPVAWCSVNYMLAADTYLVTEEPPGFAFSPDRVYVALSTWQKGLLWRVADL